MTERLALVEVESVEDVEDLLVPDCGVDLITESECDEHDPPAVRRALPRPR